MDYSLGLIALIWVIYIFLFTEADRELGELLHRVKFALAINDKGAFDPVQFDVKQHLSVAEIVELGAVINSTVFSKKIKKFQTKYEEIQHGKIFLIINLFIVSAVISADFFVKSLDSPSLFIEVHYVISLLFAFVFYYYLNSLSKVKFVKITAKDNSS